MAFLTDRWRTVACCFGSRSPVAKCCHARHVGGLLICEQSSENLPIHQKFSRYILHRTGSVEQAGIVDSQAWTVSRTATPFPQRLVIDAGAESKSWRVNPD
jgi:hypothetical protein